MAVERIELSPRGLTTGQYPGWREDMADMLRHYLSGKTVYVEFKYDTYREGAIGKLKISNVQSLLHESQSRFRYSNDPVVAEKPENVNADYFMNQYVYGSVTWDGRKNKVNNLSGYDLTWLKGHEGGTVWAYAKPEVPKVVALDKLGDEIQVGDFISYILYHFDNSHNAAGLYFGKVTKIDKDGTVWAKNIKLKDSDQTDEKAIKDNSLIIIMSKDLMNKLMMARLAVL